MGVEDGGIDEEGWVTYLFGVWEKGVDFVEDFGADWGDFFGVHLEEDEDQVKQK